VAAVKAMGEEVWGDLVPILQEDIEAFLASRPV
jgi:hypothetical protein